jgi:TolB-like protein
LPASPPEVPPERDLQSQPAFTRVFSVKASGGRRPWFATAFSLAALALLVLWHFTSYKRADTRLAERSIAVLPFASNHPDHDAFSRRITDQIIDALRLNPNLTVVSRAAARSRDPSLRYIVQGRVRAVGPRSRVLTELIDIHSRQVLWVGRFDHATTDGPAVLDQIGAEVVGRLVIRIGQAEQQRMQTPAAAYLEAYDHVISYGQMLE